MMTREHISDPYIYITNTISLQNVKMHNYLARLLSSQKQPMISFH